MSKGEAWVMQDLEKRLAAVEDVLGKLSAGQFAAENELAPGDDALGRVERALNYLLMDLQTLTLANQEREAFLVEQHSVLQQKSKTVELQSRALAERDRELEVKLRVI